jgi:hypothetical protein
MSQKKRTGMARRFPNLPEVGSGGVCVPERSGRSRLANKRESGFPAGGVWVSGCKSPHERHVLPSGGRSAIGDEQRVLSSHVK